MRTPPPTIRRRHWRVAAAAALVVTMLTGAARPSSAVESCTDDPREDDDTYQAATHWGNGNSADGVLCDDADYVAIDAVTGDTITATLQQVAADGDLDITLSYADEVGEDVRTTTIPDPHPISRRSPTRSPGTTPTTSRSAASTVPRTPTP